MSTAPRTLYIAEPPPQYLARPPLVVDCSTIAGIVFGEPWQDSARARIVGRTLHAPHLLHCEIANVALKKQRRGEAHAEAGLADAISMSISLHPIDALAVAGLAQRYQLSAYDAAYLWLAADLKCPLATLDGKLGEAALAHLSSLP